MTQLAHPIEEGLSRFTLIGSIGDGQKTACAMSLLNWIWRNGDDWTDAPDCVHPIIRAAVITANDAVDTTAEMRAELVRMGEHGVLDTWWVPTEVVAASLAGERGGKPPSSYDRAVACLQRVAAWKETRERPYLAYANLAGANLAGAHLARADLTGANLARASLVGASLAYANLAYANLAGAHLTGADLVSASLARASLVGASLVGASLARADLTGAHLTGADLVSADLTGANLARADLTGANLAGADLTGANLAGANLAGANLADAYGNALTHLPVGWKVTDSGLVVRDA